MRSYNIADHLEFWKEIAIKYKGTFDHKALKTSAWRTSILEITNEEQLYNPEDKTFIMTHRPIDQDRKKALDKYFSDLVLTNYFYVIVDNENQVKEIFWDKP